MQHLLVIDALGENMIGIYNSHERASQIRDQIAAHMLSDPLWEKREGINLLEIYGHPDYLDFDMEIHPVHISDALTHTLRAHDYLEGQDDEHVIQVQRDGKVEYFLYASFLSAKNAVESAIDSMSSGGCTIENLSDGENFCGLGKYFQFICQVWDDDGVYLRILPAKHEPAWIPMLQSELDIK